MVNQIFNQASVLYRGPISFIYLIGGIGLAAQGWEEDYKRIGVLGEDAVLLIVGWAHILNPINRRML